MLKPNSTRDFNQILINLYFSYYRNSNVFLFWLLRSLLEAKCQGSSPYRPLRIFFSYVVFILVLQSNPSLFGSRFLFTSQSSFQCPIFRPFLVGSCWYLSQSLLLTASPLANSCGDFLTRSGISGIKWLMLSIYL